MNKIFYKKIYNKGFTLIELMVVIAIIGVMSSVVLASVNNSRLKGKDAKRLSDMRQIQNALYFYYDDNGGDFPQEDSTNGDWEISTEDGGDFLDLIKDDGYMTQVPLDPMNDATHYYAYYVYDAGSYGCDASRGEFYILGILDMESTGRPHPQSPGFSCSGRDWQNEFDWVAGKFEDTAF